jgi:hypothetical protein
MTTDRKRARADADAPELSGKEAASTSYAAAASSPAIVLAASASLMLSSTATTAAAAGVAAAAAASESKAEESGSDSDSEDEQSEIVIVRMPASLVHQMREKEGRSVSIQGLDTAHPFFDATYALPLPSSSQVAEPTTQRFVGTYEYSVGTQLLWEIKDGESEQTTDERSDGDRADECCGAC